MRTFRLGSAAVLNAGVLTNAVLDTLIDSRAGYPAVVPAPVFGSASVPPGIVYTGTWSGAATTTPNSSASFTFTGYGVLLDIHGSPTAGGIAWITLDGSPRLAMDATQAPPGFNVTQLFLTPNGGAHTLTITWYGDVGAGTFVVEAPTNTVGTSVAPLLSPVHVNRAATTSTTWTIVALDATHVSINGSGSYALGTVVTGVVTGVDLYLLTGTMTTGDTATFATTACGITIQGMAVATSESTAASWTSPLIEGSGAALVTGAGQPTVYPLPLTDPAQTSNAPLQWLCLAWEEDVNYPITSGYASTGNTLNPGDASWSTTPAANGYSPTQLAISHDGLGNGYMGLAVLPSGTYAQVSLNIPTGGYMRNPRLYAWDPNTDPDLNRFPPVPGYDNEDPLAMRLYGALAVGQTIVERDPMREVLASTSLGTAVGQYLDMHGLEWSLPRPFGADDSVYAAILRYLSAARQFGGTVGFLRKALSILLGPNAVFSVTELQGTTTTWILGTSLLGVDTVLGGYTPNAWEVQFSFTTSSLVLPPQLVQSLVLSFLAADDVPIFIWQ